MSKLIALSAFFRMVKSPLRLWHLECVFHSRYAQFRVSSRKNTRTSLASFLECLDSARVGSDRLGRGARSWGGPRRKTPSPATQPRHDCELSVSGGIHGGHTHEGRTKEDDGTQGAGPTSCVRRARERKNLAARSQNSRKDGDHNGDDLMTATQVGDAHDRD